MMQQENVKIAVANRQIVVLNQLIAITNVRKVRKVIGDVKVIEDHVVDQELQVQLDLQALQGQLVQVERQQELQGQRDLREQLVQVEHQQELRGQLEQQVLVVLVQRDLLEQLV
jgi:hypothetical protein